MTGKTANTRTIRSNPSAKNEQGEYATFTDALKKVLSVPRSEIGLNANAEKKIKVSSRVSRAKA